MKLTIRLLVLLAGLSAYAHAQSWSGIIDSDRGVDWSTAGVVGDIPSASWPNCVTTACNTLFDGNVSASTINSALSSAPNNTVVRIPPGTFSVACFSISRSNVVLRGAGADQTRLNMTSGCSGNGFGMNRVITIGSSATGTGRFGGATTANWTAGYAKDATVITLSNTSGITPGPVGTGTLLFLDQQDDTTDGWPAAGDIFSCATSANGCSNQGGNNYARSGRAQVQVITATAVNGNQVTISPGLAYPNWRAAKNPGAYWNTGSPAHNVGLEDLFIDMTPSGAPSGVWVVNCANCWVKGNKIIKTDNCGTCAAYYLWTIQSAHCTLRSNYVYGRPWTSGGSFPLENYIYSDYETSDMLIENNIFHHVISGILPNDPGGRNVFGYNYVVGGFLGVAGVQLHSGNVMFDLFEGNDMQSFMADTAHATHHFITAFRNLMDGNANNNSQTHNHGFDIETNNRFFNIIGNVIGNSNWNTYECNLSGCSYRNIFTIGWQGNTSGTPVANDSNVKRTLMRWGNWDNVNNTARFVSAEVPSGITNFANPVPSSQTLPPSFYLNSKPAWFGSVPYPPIGPDVTGGNVTNSPTGGHAYKIPARVCYETTTKDGAGILQFNANRCYGQGLSDQPAPPTITSTTVQ